MLGGPGSPSLQHTSCWRRPFWQKPLVTRFCRHCRSDPDWGDVDDHNSCALWPSSPGNNAWDVAATETGATPLEHNRARGGTQGAGGGGTTAIDALVRDSAVFTILLRRHGSSICWSAAVSCDEMQKFTSPSCHDYLSVQGSCTNLYCSSTKVFLSGCSSKAFCPLNPKSGFDFFFSHDDLAEMWTNLLSKCLCKTAVTGTPLHESSCWQVSAKCWQAVSSSAWSFALALIHTCFQRD